MPNTQAKRIHVVADLQTRLDEIAAEMKAGAPASRFKDEMDQLLGTAMEDRDREAEASWQAAYGPRSIDE